MLRLGLVRVLQTVDVRVVGEAATRVEGIRAAREGPADLILAGDHTDGQPHELVREAKALPNGPRVIVLLGQVDSEDVGAVLAAGADGLLVRSVGADELADSISRVVDGERVVSPALMPIVIDAMTGTSGDRRSASTGDTAALTAKEREVLAQLADGRSNQQIA